MSIRRRCAGIIRCVNIFINVSFYIVCFICVIVVFNILFINLFICVILTKVIFWLFLCCR